MKTYFSHGVSDLAPKISVKFVPSRIAMNLPLCIVCIVYIVCIVCIVCIVYIGYIGYIGYIACKHFNLQVDFESVKRLPTHDFNHRRETTYRHEFRAMEPVVIVKLFSFSARVLVQNCLLMYS